MRRHSKPPVKRLGQVPREAAACIDGQQKVASRLNRGAGESNRTDDMMETVPVTANCTFVGEGRANVVFTLTDIDGRPAFQGKLLRVPKHNYKALPYSDLQNYWEAQVSPLFEPHELVQQRLVKLPSDPAFVARLNHELEALEKAGHRRSDFVGHLVDADVEIGMLVEDMRAHAAGSGVLRTYEIKPKWLVQSPRAPRGAEQCRNCAREVWRNMKNKTKNQVFCPLNLVKAADFPHDENVAKDIATNLRRCYNMSEVEAKNLTAWLRTCQLIPRLRTIQWSHDHESQVIDDEQYCLAMTLRDCSLFVLLPSDPDAPPERIIAKLGDTDMKNFAAKKEYWLKMEREFHDSGVYWNTDKLSVALTDCQLPFYKARKDMPDELRRYYLSD